MKDLVKGKAKTQVKRPDPSLTSSERGGQRGALVSRPADPAEPLHLTFSTQLALSVSLCQSARESLGPKLPSRPNSINKQGSKNRSARSFPSTDD